MMSQHALNKRRALIVRRWIAYRTECVQREIWRKRRAMQADDLDGAGSEDDLLPELPDGLMVE